MLWCEAQIRKKVNLKKSSFLFSMTVSVHFSRRVSPLLRRSVLVGSWWVRASSSASPAPRRDWSRLVVPAVHRQQRRLVVVEVVAAASAVPGLSARRGSFEAASSRCIERPPLASL